MKKHKGLVPKHMVIPMLIVLIYHFLVYDGAHFITKGSTHHNLLTKLDDMIPFMPWMVVIYLTSFIFWVVNYIWSVQYDRDKAMQLAIGDLIGKTLCLAVFLFLPTEIVRPEVTANGFLGSVVGFVFWIDKPNVIFPSMHCFMSWMCWRGVQKLEQIPKWYRIFSLIFAIAVCISTVTVKQHLVVDIFSGILFAEIGYRAAGYLIKKHNKAQK